MFTNFPPLHEDSPRRPENKPCHHTSPCEDPGTLSINEEWLAKFIDARLQKMLETTDIISSLVYETVEDLIEKRNYPV